MTAVVDYGVGNLFSLNCSFAAAGCDTFVTDDADEIRKADKIILPGVGAFADAAEKLRASGLDRVIINEAENGKPLLGICLGMQLLFDRSLEYGETRGLGLIKGTVGPISEMITPGLKIPHIGWNPLIFTKKSPLLGRIKDGDCVYFVHSFAAKDCGESVIAKAEYGGLLTAAVQKDNIFGCQFHPEKSGSVGLNILKAFCEDI